MTDDEEAQAYTLENLTRLTISQLVYYNTAEGPTSLQKVYLLCTSAFLVSHTG